MNSNDAEHRACTCPSEPGVHCHSCTKAEHEERLRGDGLRRISERIATARTYGSSGINAWASRYASDAAWLHSEVARLDDMLTAVRDALADHPEACEATDDPVSCGWKRAVLDVQDALNHG